MKKIKVERRAKSRRSGNGAESGECWSAILPLTLFTQHTPAVGTKPMFELFRPKGFTHIIAQ